MHWNIRSGGGAVEETKICPKGNGNRRILAGVLSAYSAVSDAKIDLHHFSTELNAAYLYRTA
jgi:hypothetical protein